MRQKTQILGFIVLSALVAASCAPRKGAVKKEGRDKQQADKALSEGLAPGTEVTEASLRGGEFVSVPELGAIYFDYDSFSLQPTALATLKSNARYLKENPALEVLVAGNCDERGTIEYNLALGQKRAKGVRDYYMSLGVPGNRVATISYGKEQPVCAESNEECWSQNRRAETQVRSGGKISRNGQ